MSEAGPLTRAKLAHVAERHQRAGWGLGPPVPDGVAHNRYDNGNSTRVETICWWRNRWSWCATIGPSWNQFSPTPCISLNNTVCHIVKRNAGEAGVGRPPIGKKAMTTAERQRRYWERVLGRGAAAPPDDPAVRKLERELKQALARIAELEARPAIDQRGLSRTSGMRSRPEFGEVGKLRAENGRLRAQIKLLTPALDGELVKLRKVVEELRGERASLKRALKEVARERDRNAVIRSSPILSAAAHGHLRKSNYRRIVGCLHSDTRHSKTAAQIDEAAVLFIPLEPLFQFAKEREADY
jgi:hypothetical protein